jgi:hypothetical protein
MIADHRLNILKHSLQRQFTSANDEYLNHLLDAAEAAIKREGIKDDDTADYENCVIDYAAYLFRKRAGSETAMPRFLRWQLNNILMSQKAKEATVSE